jgi:hypothetical protein
MAVVKFSEYCCQPTAGSVDTSKFSLNDLTIHEDASSVLRFSPLGNTPTAPKVALVGITPGSQIDRFVAVLREGSVKRASAAAAFHKAHGKIRKMLEAHDFASVLGIRLTEDVNDSPDILTTSLVKCGLARKDGYQYAAPDIAKNTWATHCVCTRFLPEIFHHDTLTHVVTFGDEGLAALEAVKVDEKSVLVHLRDRGLVILNFPHFANCQQRQDIFNCSEVDEPELLRRKPHYKGYAPVARRLRAAVIAEVKRLRAGLVRT